MAATGSSRTRFFPSTALLLGSGPYMGTIADGLIALSPKSFGFSWCAPLAQMDRAQDS